MLNILKFSVFKGVPKEVKHATEIEEGRIDRKWIELYCKGDWKSCVRYHMEERGEPHPDWMLPDGSLDERLRD